MKTKLKLKHPFKRLGVWIKQYNRAIIVTAILSVVLFLSGSVVASLNAHGKEYSVSNVPQRDVGIIFGAGLETPTKASNFLESRLIAGVQLYKAGKVRVLLVSGDNAHLNHNEPVVMRDYLVAHGVPPQAIVLDYAGFDTYDTCYRARHIFGVTQATLISHGYHLPRAIFTCQELGINSIGLRADRSDASFSKLYLLREMLSSDKMLIQLLLHEKASILGPSLNSVPRALSFPRQ